MKYKNISFIVFITLLALAALACNFGRATPTVEPAKPAEATQPAKEPEVEVPGVALGAEGRSAEGGFTYREVPGYSVESGLGVVTMLAPGADPDLGPVISLMGGLTDMPITAEEQLATLTESGEVTASETRPITIDGVTGLEVDITRSNGGPVGRVAVIMITENQQFVILAGAPSDRWESELLPLYEAELAAITFFEPEVTALPTEPPVSQVEEEIRQWASSAIASSEYGSSDWSAAQAFGAPDTTACGDQGTAWAAAESNTVEWIELTYAAPVTPKQVNIHISYNPTYITKVELFDIYGEYHQIYEFEARSYPECPYIFSIDVTEEGFQAVGVKITIDQTTAPGWVEIDAVELVGMGDPSLLGNPAEPEPGTGGAVFPAPDGFVWRTGGPSGFEEGKFPGLYGMDVSDSTGLLYVTDAIRSVRIFDLQGIFVGEITHPDLSVPDDIKIGPDGNLYVSAWGSGKVFIFSPEGELLSSFGERGTGDGQFGDFSPDRIAVGPEGNVYVVDDNKDAAGNYIERIQVFTSQGKYLRTINYPDEFFSAGGIDVGSDGNLYVVGFIGSRILQFTPEGELVREIGEDVLRGLGGAQALTLDTNGNFYLALWSTGMVKLDEEGNLLATWGVPVDDGTLDWSEGGFYQQGGIAVLPDGSRVFFSDTSSQFTYLTAFHYP